MAEFRQIGIKLIQRVPGIDDETRASNQAGKMAACRLGKNDGSTSQFMSSSSPLHERVGLTELRPTVVTKPIEGGSRATANVSGSDLTLHSLEQDELDVRGMSPRIFNFDEEQDQLKPEDQDSSTTDVPCLADLFFVEGLEV